MCSIGGGSWIELTGAYTVHVPEQSNTTVVRVEDGGAGLIAKPHYSDLLGDHDTSWARIAPLRVLCVEVVWIARYAVQSGWFD